MLADRSLVVSMTLGVVAQANVKDRPKRPATVVLHPRWHLAAPGRVAGVLANRRDVFIEDASGSGVLLDEQTGKRVTLTPPTGCYFDLFNSRAIGDSWVVATCNQPPAPTYELYSVPRGSWMPLNPNLKRLFASGRGRWP